MTDEREDRLPKWARQKIETLRGDVEFWKAKASAGPEDSDTFVATMYGELDRPLGRGETIRFIQGRDEWNREVGIEARLESNGRVFITTRDGPLKITPWASNCCYVEQDKR